MILKIFTVFDSKVGAYLQPFFCRSTGEAIRSFTDACNRDGNFKSHPTDFTLFEVGTWDDVDCKIISLVTPTSLGLSSEFLSAIV